MARKSLKRSRKQTHKRRQRGGGWGFTGASSIPGPPGIVSNPQVFTAIGDCRAVEPGYTIPKPYTNFETGLPGMKGGKRKTKKGSKGRKTRRQRGGRYGFFPQGDPNPSGQAWWAGSYAPIARIGCEGSTPNPMNPPPHTPSTAPSGALPPNFWMGGQRGGAQPLAPAGYGVGNVDSMYHYAPTAAYGNVPSTWRDSVGAPVLLQVPEAGRQMNQACLTTGGPPPLTGALQKGGRRRRRMQGGFTNPFAGLFARMGLGGTPAPEAAPPAVPAVPAVEEEEEEEANENLTNENVKGAKVVTEENVFSDNESNGNTNTNIGEEEDPQMGGRKRKHKRSHKKRTHKVKKH